MHESRKILVGLMLLATSCGQVSDRKHGAISGDLRSETWRKNRTDEIVLQSHTIVELDSTIALENRRNGKYSHKVDDWINRLTSDDSNKIASALFDMKQHQRVETALSEVLVGLVVPLLSNPGDVFWASSAENGGLDGPIINASISSLAANAISTQVPASGRLVAPLAEYLLTNETAPCPTLQRVLIEMSRAIANPEDLETAALAIFEVSQRDPWMAVDYPLREGKFSKGVHQCAPQEISRQMLSTLRKHFPDSTILTSFEVPPK